MSSRVERNGRRVLTKQTGLRSMANATSAPALFDGVQVVHSAEREDHALSCGMHRRVSRAGAGKPVLLDQRIKNQSAVDAAQHSTVCGVIRSRFRDHESFAFLASHLPTSCIGWHGLLERECNNQRLTRC
jgi:hypothetical protein